jgi:hypothetical protein
MPGNEFFFAVLVFGGAILGFGGLAGLRLKQRRWNGVEARGLRFALEFGLFTAVFALVPFVLFYLFSFETVVWRLSSLLLAAFLGTEMVRIAYQVWRFGALWPATTTLLLVFSGILLTIEGVNVLWWGALVGYAIGLLWIVILAGTQLIAFVCYDRSGISATQGYQVGNAGRGDVDPGRYGHHGLLGQRLQRDHRADHPYGAAYDHADTQRHAVGNTGRSRHAHRLAFTRTRDGHGRTVANPVVRPDPDSGR